MEKEEVVEILENLYKYIYISVSSNEINNYLENTDNYCPVDEFYFSNLNKSGISDKSLLYNHIKNIKTNVYFTKLLNMKKAAQKLLNELGIQIKDEVKFENIKSVENLIDFQKHIKTYILPQILSAINDKDFEDYIFENSPIFNKKDKLLIQFLFMSDINESNINALKYYCEEEFILTEKIEEYFVTRSFLLDNLYNKNNVLI